eukprot:6648373-Prymnesium_polylepis.1
MEGGLERSCTHLQVVETPGPQFGNLQPTLIFAVDIRQCWKAMAKETQGRNSRIDRRRSSQRSHAALSVDEPHCAAPLECPRSLKARAASTAMSTWPLTSTSSKVLSDGPSAAPRVTAWLKSAGRGDALASTSSAAAVGAAPEPGPVSSSSSSHGREVDGSSSDVLYLATISGTLGTQHPSPITHFWHPSIGSGGWPSAGCSARQPLQLGRRRIILTAPWPCHASLGSAALEAPTLPAQQRWKRHTDKVATESSIARAEHCHLVSSMPAGRPSGDGGDRRGANDIAGGDGGGGIGVRSGGGGEADGGGGGETGGGEGGADGGGGRGAGGGEAAGSGAGGRNGRK